MSVVIIGGGLAGATVATELRELDYQDPITLVAAEDHLPYERPPLSKDVLLGKADTDSATVKDADWYRDNNVTLLMGTRVTSINREDNTVTTENGETLDYTKLVLATGSQPTPLPAAEESGKPVFYLRTAEDSNRLKAALKDKPNIAIIGGGWIGLEVAAAARENGCEVTVFIRGNLPLEKVLGPEVAEIFANLHRDHGVTLKTNTTPTTDDLKQFDMIVVGIGAYPDVQLAEDAGLAVDDGVLVNDRLQTSDPNIYAIGDIANEDHPTLGRLRVQHWDNAIEQAKTAAANIAGKDTVYDKQPYFFTDQYDLGMEYFGNVDHTKDGKPDYDRVEIKGDPKGAFQAYWLKDGKVKAAMQANDWDNSEKVKNSLGTAM